METVAPNGKGVKHMAYLDHNRSYGSSHDASHRHSRIAGATGVALVHIALAVGLVSGLTIKVFNPPEDEPLVTFDTDPVVPTPDPTTSPEPNPTSTTTRPIILIPTPPIHVNQTQPVETVIDFPPTDEVVRVLPTVPDRGPITQPDPIPTFTPRGPVPANGPAGWVTNNDYPGRALTREHEGNVSYSINVDARGRVLDCRIVSSSGHDTLDNATCRLIERRARFNPATDRTGAEVSGTYRGLVSWVIPQD